LDAAQPIDAAMLDAHHAAPTLGAHGLSFYRFNASSPTSISTPAMSTHDGSTLVVSIGRGDISAFALPTDSFGNTPYAQRDTTHAYHYWPTSGTALYTFVGAHGGANFRVTTTTPSADEITIAAVEVLGGTSVVSSSWNDDTSGAGVSGNVTTTGPATLVAFWWGEADGSMTNTATPDGGFVVVDSVLEMGSLVQCAVAVRSVAVAGTYHVTWTATPSQAAQLWLVAVQ